MHTIIDETVLLRYLLDDNKRQANEAAAVIATGLAYTYPEILARTAVTLRDVYAVPRETIGRALDAVLDEVKVGDEDIVRLACRMFATSQLDFTDCMMLARNTLRNCRLLSFSRGIAKRALP